MNKLTVISGEAPETDSEDESTSIQKINPSLKTIKGTAVHGEDSESEDDGDASVASVAPTASSSSKYDQETKLPTFMSLLHKKLIETNQKFQLELNSWCEDIVYDNCNVINDTEQNLLQSQIMLQGAVDSLRVIVNNTTRLRDKLDIIFQEGILDNVKLNEI